MERRANKATLKKILAVGDRNPKTAGSKKIKEDTYMYAACRESQITEYKE